METARTLRFVAAAVVVALGAARAAAAQRIAVRADPPKLDWSLFRAVDALPGTVEAAHIAAEMSFPQPLKIEGADGGYRMPGFTITVAPQRQQTTVRRSAERTADLLRHEQGHYDILVLAARALARELESTTAGSAAEVSHRVQTFVDKHTERAARLSELYDRQTNHSRDSTEQAHWNLLIADALEDRTPTELAGMPL